MCSQNNYSNSFPRVILTLVMLLYGVGVDAAPPGARAMPVEAVTVKTGTVNVDVSAVGTLLSNESVIIRPEISGRISAIYFQEGQWTEQNAKIVSLDAAEYRARLAESTAAVKIAQLGYNRVKDLLRKKLASQQQFDEETAKLDEAKARQALDQDRLKKTVLRAPFSGMLGLRRVSPGDFVQPGQDIVSLDDIHSLKLDFRIPETDLAQLKPGLSITVRSDAFPRQTFTGSVYAISPRLDEASRSVLLRARVDNVDDKLRPGMFAKVSLRLAQRENAVLIPEEALWPIGQDLFVYRVIEGKAELTKVTTAHRFAGQVEILEGLAAGETVVTGGQMKLRKGAPVMVLNGKPPAKAN